MSQRPEYILCAALHVKHKDIAPVTFNPVNIKEGYVVTGFRHMYIKRFMIENELPGYRGEYDQGFLTSKNRFVDRIEAGKIALAANQITPDEFTEGDELISEDLY